MMRCSVLNVELRLLQFMSPFFCVFCFFLLLVVLIAFEGYNDTLEVLPYLRLLVWLGRARWLL
jgi:hypothetical protein